MSCGSRSNVSFRKRIRASTPPDKDMVENLSCGGQACFVVYIQVACQVSTSRGFQGAARARASPDEER